MLLLEPESGTFRRIFQHFPCQKSFHRNNNPLIMSKLTKRLCFLKKSGQKWGSLQKGAKIVRLSLFFLSILTFQKMRIGKSPCILLIQIKTPFPRLNDRLWSHKTMFLYKNKRILFCPAIGFNYLCTQIDKIENMAQKSSKQNTGPQEGGNSNGQFEIIAKTFVGLEPILAKELRELGAEDVKEGRRMVSFTGDKRMMYRANFKLRTAIRILKPITHFKARSADDVYEGAKKIDWSQYLDNSKTFTVDAVVFSEEFRHSKFVSYKIKDAIVDQFRERTGERPNISVANPDIRLNIHIAEDRCTLSLDSSGESLHRRGYRQEQVEAPLNEVLAAGMILMTGWHGETDFIDPMCGSGTLPIEAALIAHNMAPGLFRKEYAFEKWADFDSEMFDEIYNDDSDECEFEHHIYGYDIDMKAVSKALRNVKAAGLSKDITIEQADFKDFVQPKEKSIIITNPPYGERISTPNLLDTYQMIGERLKHQFVGNDAWVLSYREECFDQIGLKPSLKVPLFNGALECEFRRYQLFDGKYREFRSTGGEVKSEEEKRAMAQKNRFKKHREFKQRLEEVEENEANDIRSFKMHTSSLQEYDRKREERASGERKDARPFDKDRRGKRPFEGRERRDNRKFGRKTHNEQRKTRRNNHEN